MADFFGSILWMLVSLGILVTFHEFGHYWVARRCGVKVLRFSVGFGKPLWRWHGRNGTEFVIAAIPLGGYVKMLGERGEDENEVPASERHSAFNNKTVWQRIAIVAAGPLANILLCIALLWAMFVIGKQDYSATLGRTTGMATQAGLLAGERIIEVEGRSVETWTEVGMMLTTAAMDGHDARLRVRDQLGNERSRVLPLSTLPEGFDERTVMEQAGLIWQFWLYPPLIDRVQTGSAADGLLQAGDLIVAITGQRVESADQVPDLVRQLGESGRAGLVEIERNGQRLALELTPQQSTDESHLGRWLLGVGFAQASVPDFDAVQQYGLVAALPIAVRETGRLTVDSLGMIKRMLTGQASAKNISGPITIARVANASAQRGLDWFLYFLALVSLSLGILNLLPIPILDGGHLLYYLIELLKGSPLSERSMMAGHYLGLMLLIGLMGLAFHNDIVSLLP